MSYDDEYLYCGIHHIKIDPDKEMCQELDCACLNQDCCWLNDIEEWTESPATSTEDGNPSKVREDAQQETSSESEGRRGDTS